MTSIAKVVVKCESTKGEGRLTKHHDSRFTGWFFTVENALLPLSNISYYKIGPQNRTLRAACFGIQTMTRRKEKFVTMQPRRLSVELLLSHSTSRLSIRVI